MLTADVRSRVEPDLKREAEAVLKASGLDVSTAIRLFLRSVVETGGLPMAMPRPNPETLAAIKAARAGETTETTLDDLQSHDAVMSRKLKETATFKSDKKRIKGSGRYDWEKMRAIGRSQMNDKPLLERHRDHALSGEWVGVRDCHIEPDWLLLYEKSGDLKTGELRLIRTGTHSELF